MLIIQENGQFCKPYWKIGLPKVSLPTLMTLNWYCQVSKGCSSITLQVTYNCSAFGAIFCVSFFVRENLRGLRENLKHKIRTLGAGILWFVWGRGLTRPLVVQFTGQKHLMLTVTPSLLVLSTPDKTAKGKYISEKLQGSAIDFIQHLGILFSLYIFNKNKQS